MVTEVWFGLEDTALVEEVLPQEEIRNSNRKPIHSLLNLSTDERTILSSGSIPFAHPVGSKLQPACYLTLHPLIGIPVPCD